MDGRPSLDRRALSLVIALSLARVLFHLLSYGGYGIFRDELYYLACSEHLDFGYVDHPPLAPALAWLSRNLFGGSLFALRLLPALAGGCTVFLAGISCYVLGGQRAALGLTCLCVAVAPVLLAFGHTFSMNVFEPLFWGTGTLLLVRLAQGGSQARLWLWFGVVAGLGLQNKHSMLFFGVAALVAALGTPGLRSTLRTRWPWLALVIALVLFSPNLIWQAQHGFPTLEFMHNARAYKNVPLSPLTFMAEQVILSGPLAAPVWAAGLWFSFTPSALSRGARPIGLVYLTLLAIFVFTQAKPYYLAPAYPLLFAAGGVAIERLGARIAKATSVAVLAGGAISVPMVVPVLPEATFVKYTAALGIALDSAERQALGALPQFFADMHGWQALAEDVARAWAQLPESERAHCSIFANNYGEAGAIDRFGPALGLPKAIAGHNSYWLWGPGDARGECVLVIGGKRADHQKAYGEVEALGESRDSWRMPYENVTLWLLRKPRQSLRELWPRVKHYI